MNECGTKKKEETVGKQRKRSEVQDGNRIEKGASTRKCFYLDVVRPMPALVLVVCEITEGLAALEQR
jgi:hypothetical protein